MTTELSFLIDLLLNHKLQKTTKELIQARIKDVESNLAVPVAPVQLKPQQHQTQPSHPDPFIAKQAPSTQALLTKDPHAPPGVPGSSIATSDAAALPVPVPATNRIVGGEVTQKLSGGTTRGPRKW